MGGKVSDNLAGEVALLIDYIDDVLEKLVAIHQHLRTQQSDQLKERETQLMLELGFEEPKVEKTSAPRYSPPSKTNVDNGKDNPF